jgi:hypothetical protein
VIDTFFPAQHTISQMRGISLCYHAAIRQKGDLSPADLERALKVERVERIAFRVLLASEVLYWVPRFVRMLFNQHLPGRHLLRYLSILGLVGASLAILWNGRRYPGHESTRKMVFLLRVLLFPLRPLTSVFNVVIRATHGTEYLIVFRKIVGGSALDEVARARIYYITAAALVAFAGLCVLTNQHFLWLVFHWQAPSSLLIGALFLDTVVRYLHFYMDAVIYRMSDPATRAAVAPLLGTAKAAARRELAA